MKAGLEVHQQLATGKLFCACPAELSEEGGATVRRRLRATGGENHAVDRAAQFEAARGEPYEYEVASTSCLVELDEEPPHRLNPEAVEVALRVALALRARPIDEIQVMRKIVVDGSNTTGFQRTALVAVDGTLVVGEKRYSIPSICLEEDAARRVGEKGAQAKYRLDRLGMPLIEVSTGPEITSGEEARAVAEEIGALLRATGRVRRGIGTIREDLNVSTEGGARVEMKGVQELRLISRYSSTEEARQRLLLELAEKLRARSARVEEDAPQDLGPELGPSVTGPVADAVRKGGVFLGMKLTGFGGLLGSRPGSEERLGRELADYARTAGVRGLLHSDELPNAFLDGGAVARVREALRVGPNDGFVLIAATEPERARLALDRVRARARAAIEGVPEETRDPLPDGRSRYSRPLPGRDRMYPETDVPPVAVDAVTLERLSEVLPELPRATRARLVRQYGLSEELSTQLSRAGEVERFERLSARGHSPALVARLLVNDLPATTAGSDAEKTPPDLSEATLDALLSAVERGRFAKEGIPAVLRGLMDGAPDVDAAAERAGLSGGDEEELRRMAEDVVRTNAELIRARGAAAFSPLMGDLMAKARGRYDGQAVARALRDAMARAAPAAPG